MIGKIVRNAAGVRVRVQRIYRTGANVVLRDGTRVAKGDELAIVSLVGNPKLTEYYVPSSLQPDK